jgi:anti-sigma regulatory factor (Ser/Thr protein kinase)
MPSSRAIERQFAKSTDSLEAIFDYITEFAQTHGVSEAVVPVLHFGVEEVFTNMVRYNTESCNDVSIRLSLESDSFSIALTDHEVHSYDPNTRPPVDTAQPLHERTPGGLGIHLVREMMDDVRYEYENRSARIILIKHLET